MMFTPDWRVIPLTAQLVVPDAVPPPQRSHDHVTCVTAILSEAMPPRFRALANVLRVGVATGDVMAIVGGDRSGGV